MYRSIASLISLFKINSFAVCDRAESPGPIFTEVKGIKA